MLPIPWRDVDLVSGKPIRWGVLWDDGEYCAKIDCAFSNRDLMIGVVAPSPACKRALETVVSELTARGHEVVAMYAEPMQYRPLLVANRLVVAVEILQAYMRASSWVPSYS